MAQLRKYEFWSGRVEEIKDDVRDMGITVLAGAQTILADAVDVAGRTAKQVD